MEEAGFVPRTVASHQLGMNTFTFCPWFEFGEVGQWARGFDADGWAGGTRTGSRVLSGLAWSLTPPQRKWKNTVNTPTRESINLHLQEQPHTHRHWKPPSPHTHTHALGTTGNQSSVWSAWLSLAQVCYFLGVCLPVTSQIDYFSRVTEIERAINLKQPSGSGCLNTDQDSTSEVACCGAAVCFLFSVSWGDDK